MATMKAPQRRYVRRMALAMAIYVASLFLADHLIEDRGVSGLAAYALALVPGLCVASIFWIVGRLIVEQDDEFLRMLIVRQSLIATGLAFTGAAVWGFLEQFDLVAHVDAYWWPVWWCFGLGAGGLANRITHGTWGNCW
ncbi:MAG: hypothetical protein KDE15_12680 [Erythrobacter sp.]|nr:hypothetical protein [Erythrobacter sp.]